MPRRSVAALLAPAIIVAPPPRIAPPSELSAAERRTWRATVGALPPDWFKREQGPVLTQYCRLVAQAGTLARLLAECDPVADFERYGKLLRLSGEVSGRILALARAMRLTQQARLHVTTAANRAAAARPERTPQDEREAVLAVVADAKAWRDGKRHD